MTWQTKYQVTLTTNNPLTSNYNYVVEIPAINYTDTHIRLALRPPTSGSARVQAMYIGHGTGYSFDGSQVPVKVLGNTNFILSGGLVYSDPIPVASFGFDVTKKINIAYEILSGDNYRSVSSLPADYKLHYKTGTGDSVTTTKSGYSTIASRTAMLEAVQFVDVIPEEEPEDIPSSNSDIKQLIEGERLSSGADVPGVTGKHLHFQFKNPSASGKLGLLYEVEICPEYDTVMTLRSYGEDLANIMSKCNLKFGFGQGTMHCRWGHADSILGNFHSIHKLKGGKRNIIKLDIPLVAMIPGQTTVMALHSEGVGAVGNIQWREITNN
jgi:hypothetical protein